MAIWNIEQKAEVWYSTSVEADTFDEAVMKAEEEESWYLVDDALGIEFTGKYWAQNTETRQEFTK